jgi:TPR repeat protein
MKMKTRFLLFLTLVSLKLLAQNNISDSITEAQLKEAKKYLFGIGIPRNEQNGFSLYKQIAEGGNSKAMNIVGKLYAKGTGTAYNENQAIYWLTKAAQNGIIEGWYNIALLYKERADSPDFEKAYKYFDTAANHGDAQSVYALAYMHYKGLGCQQDYSKAASFFKKGAVSGRANSMYFYGLCWRNGYGLSTNQDSANYWLQKAANKGYKMAINELATNEAENNNTQARTLSTKLKNDFLTKNNSFNKFQKIEANTPLKVATGEYEGYLVRYDWSGQHAISSSKLTLKLFNRNGQVSGQWIENDSINVPLNAEFNSSSIVFNDMEYARKDHYNTKKGKSYSFKNANLQWSQNKDTVYLIGNIQMFSTKQNEPDKPIFISLKRYVGKTDLIKEEKSILEKTTHLKEQVNAYPNPFVNTITVDFVLKQKTDVQIQLETLEGRIVYEKKSGLLEAGTYTLYLKNLRAATYLLKVYYGKSFHTTKVVKL